MGKGVAGSLARLRVRWDCHLREVLALEVLHSCNWNSLCNWYFRRELALPLMKPWVEAWRFQEGTARHLMIHWESLLHPRGVMGHWPGHPGESVVLGLTDCTCLLAAPWVIYSSQYKWDGDSSPISLIQRGVNTGPFTKAWARCRPVTKLEQEARLKQRSHLVQGEGPGGGARHGSLGGEHDGQQAGDKELGSQIGAGLDPATLQRANGSINTALSLSLWQYWGLNSW
jgi:hypothetical protein